QLKKLTQKKISKLNEGWTGKMISIPYPHIHPPIVILPEGSQMFTHVLLNGKF
ncbi:hypothetical protein L9F63_014469, partial [Diploptera punctata]